MNKKKDKTTESSAKKPVKIVVKKERPKPKVTMTFDRWFNTLKRPQHHKAGMKAFADTKGKRTKETWDRLFQGY